MSLVDKSDAPLTGLNLLLVRPERDNDLFEQLVTGLGCRVHALPAMAIKPLVPDGLACQLLAGISRFHKVIVVSGNAARLALQYIPDSRTLPAVPAWFAVGESTAKTLQEAGVRAIFPADNATSEGLLALPAFARVRGEQILIVRGEGGRDTLRSELEQRGAAVTFCELYRRETDSTHRLAIKRLLEAGAVQVVVAHSIDVLRNFLQLLDSDSLEVLHRIAVLVPSQGAADLALARGCGDVIQAQSALPASMVDALVGWYTANSPNFSNPLYPH